MRTKQLLQAVQDTTKDLTLLLTYLALSEDHFATHAIVDPFGKVLLEHKFQMTDKGEIIKTVIHEDFFERSIKPVKLAKLSLEELLGVVSSCKLF